jgi:hypothetical protein
MTLRHGIGRFVLALGLLALAVPAAAQDNRIKDRGFVFEANIGTHLAVLDNDIPPLGDLRGGFFLGGKIGRLMIGGSIDISRAAYTTEAGGFSTDASTTRLLFMPGVRFTFLRSADERVELFGQLDLGVGPTMNDPGDDAFTFVYQVGPGLRLWFHPQLALGAHFGLRGEFTSVDTGNNSSTSYGVTGIYSTFSLLGVF